MRGTQALFSAQRSGRMIQYKISSEWRLISVSKLPCEKHTVHKVKCCHQDCKGFLWKDEESCVQLRSQMHARASMRTHMHFTGSHCGFEGLSGFRSPLQCLLDSSARLKHAVTCSGVSFDKEDMVKRDLAIGNSSAFKEPYVRWDYQVSRPIMRYVGSTCRYAFWCTE